MNSKQQGLSLVELMIAIVLGMVVLLAVTAIFSSTSRGRSEMEKSNRQTENGRYAIQLLNDNARLAGYLGEFDPTPLSLPAAMPDPCATALADLIDALPLHVQGYDDGVGAPGCIADLKDKTDILVVRRASSCVAGAPGCPDFAAGAPHFQAAQCTPASGGTELAYIANTNTDYATHYFTLSDAAADFTAKHKVDCIDLADVYRYHVHIYYVANNYEAGDGIPTLKRMELGAGGFTVMPLVEGIEDLQIEYDIDTVGNDGIPDISKTSPDSVAEWNSVMSARIHLLVRNTEKTPGHKDTRSYALADKVIASPGDEYKRHVFGTSVRFANPAWRRQ